MFTFMLRNSLLFYLKIHVQLLFIGQQHARIAQIRVNLTEFTPYFNYNQILLMCQLNLYQKGETNP